MLNALNVLLERVLRLPDILTNYHNATYAHAATKTTRRAVALVVDSSTT